MSSTSIQPDNPLSVSLLSNLALGDFDAESGDFGAIGIGCRSFHKVMGFKPAGVCIPKSLAALVTAMRRSATKHEEDTVTVNGSDKTALPSVHKQEIL